MLNIYVCIFCLKFIYWKLIYNIIKLYLICITILKMFNIFLSLFLYVLKLSIKAAENKTEEIQKTFYDV